MANVLLQEQDYSFSYNSALGAFVHSLVPAPFALTEGETYTVVWDNTEYEREAFAFTTADGTACVGIGDTMVKTGVSDGDGFAIVHDVTNGYMHLLSTEQVASHKVGVYEVAVDNTQYVIKGSTLTAIAKSIRKKTGSGDKISPTAMAAAIDNISGGGGSAEGCVTMTFMNGDTVKFTRPVYIGDDCPDPIRQGHIAEDDVKKDSTVDKVFTRNGWSRTNGGAADDTALDNVTEDRTVWAAFSEDVRLYTATYYDDDGSYLYEESLPYNSTPKYIPPAKDGLALDKWIPEEPVTGDMSYTAVWATKLDFATASWTDIRNVCDSGKAEANFAIGDTRVETSSSLGEITYCIVAFNQWDLNTNNHKQGGKAGITVMAHFTNARSVDITGAAQMNYDAYLLDSSIKNKLSHGYLFKHVKVEMDAYGATTVGTVANRTTQLWLPSYTELGLSPSSTAKASMSVLGTPYTLPSGWVTSDSIGVLLRNIYYVSSSNKKLANYTSKTSISYNSNSSGTVTRNVHNVCFCI